MIKNDLNKGNFTAGILLDERNDSGDAVEVSAVRVQTFNDVLDAYRMGGCRVLWII